MTKQVAQAMSAAGLPPAAGALAQANATALQVDHPLAPWCHVLPLGIEHNAQGVDQDRRIGHRKRKDQQGGKTTAASAQT
jgi:hypothetical protein